MSHGDALHVAIVGGGLVGSLNACFLAKRGFHVSVYEARPDIRTMEVVRGKSINLALSCRGIEALKAVGMEDVIVKEGIPMYGRMIHDLSGTRRPIPYGKSDQCIISIDRRNLNEVLLTAAEERPNVDLYFDHKCMSCDFDAGTMSFKRSDGTKVTHYADLIIGCDGAYSAVRTQIMKNVRFDYHQQYIRHGYMELCIQPTKQDEFAMEVNFLHIWPRNEFMMIALPNLDKTYTTTLFMPFEIFESIKTETDLMNFFKQHFPDSIEVLGEAELKKTFFSSKALPLMTVKCSPYNVKDKALIMGDAAHAMVPFYGQGMNCGFEDCLILDDILNQCGNDLSVALPEFTKYRNEDAKAIIDLALRNYIEMRQNVNETSFVLRKKLDNFIHRLFPNSWIPLYSMVSFTRTPYAECIKRRQRQDEVLSMVAKAGRTLVMLYVGHYIVSRGLHKPVTNAAWSYIGKFHALLGRFSR